MAYFTAVHIGGQSSQDEAEDHTADEQMDRLRQAETSRSFNAETLDEVLKVFDTLLADKAKVKYLDFHAHGYEANIGLEDGSITLDSLARFRNRGFHNIFVGGALIRILSCEFAGSAEGELMLAEFAQILLHGNGGTANALSGACYYKPGLITAGKFKETGRLVTATVNTSGNVVLTGHFYLNPHRIRLTMHALVAVLSSEMRKGGGRSRPAKPQGMDSVEELVAWGITLEDEQRMRWMGPYLKSLNELRIVDRMVQAASSLRELQAASDMLDTAAARLSKESVPVARVVNQLVGIFSHQR